MDLTCTNSHKEHLYHVLRVRAGSSTLQYLSIACLLGMGEYGAVSRQRSIAPAVMQVEPGKQRV